MKFVLKKSEFNSAEKEEPKVRLYLWKDEENGTVDLLAQKEGEGESAFHILRFLKDGTVRRPECVSGEIGFEIDKQGRIIIDDTKSEDGMDGSDDSDEDEESEDS
jgi:hypothetical protein